MYVCVCVSFVNDADAQILVRANEQASKQERERERVSARARFTLLLHSTIFHRNSHSVIFNDVLKADTCLAKKMNE